MASGGGVRHLKGGHHVCQDVHYHAISIEVERSSISSSRDVPVQNMYQRMQITFCKSVCLCSAENSWLKKVDICRGEI